MLADAAVLCDLEHAILPEHFLSGYIQNGVPLNIRVVYDIMVAR